MARFALFAVAGVAVLLGVLNYYAQESRQVPSTGVVWADTASGVVAVHVEPQGPAALAGLMAGDRLRSVDGVPVVTARDAASWPWDESARDGLTLGLERRGRSWEATLTPVLREGEGQLYAYLATVGLFFLASAVFLVSRLGVGPTTVHYYLASLAGFCLLVFSHTGRSDTLDWTFYLLDTGGRVLFPALLLHFVQVFPGRGPASHPALLLTYAPAMGLGAASLWVAGLGGALRAADPVRAVEQLDAVHLMHTALLFTASLIILAIRSARATVLSARRQLRWVSWGFGLGVMPFVIFYLIPRALQVETPPAAALSVLPLIVVPLAFSTAILKYRLADLGLLVRRGVTALTLTFFSLALFALLNQFLRQALGLPGVNKRIFTVLAAVMVFLLYPPLRKGVGILVDRAFYMGRYDYRRTLMEFGRELNSERELLPLMLKFHERIRTTLPVRTSVLLLPDAGRGGMTLMRLWCDLDDRQQDSHLPSGHPLCARFTDEDWIPLAASDREALPASARNLELHALFPMRVKEKVVGVLGVSVRDPEGEMNSEDRQLLITLAGHAASAIEGARLYEENRERMREVEMLKDYNESIVDSSQVGILVVDPAWRVRGWNAAMEALFGRSRGSVLLRPLESVFPGALVEELRQVAAPGARLDRTTLETDGRPRVFNLAVADLRGKSAQRGRVITFDEVTGQVEMEAQLLQNERLAAVGLLASGVAHEINTPLTGIASYAQLLLDEEPGNAASREILERIHKQSWRASHIANSLLNFSRSGGSGETEQVDLREIVEETLSLFGPQVRGRGVQVVFEPGTGESVVEGHRGRLQQVLLNLLLNARDAQPHGGTVRISVGSGAGGEVELAVSDDGEGISAADLDRIYDPFFTTKGRGRGTGLGLSISLGIVQDHQGRIEVDSTRGRGTRFRILLPACRQARVSA